MEKKKQRFTLSLKQKIVFPLLISALTPFILAAPFVFRELEQLRQNFIHNKVADKQGEIERAIGRAARDALEKAAVFTRLPEVQQAYAVAHQGDINDETDPKAQEARELLRQDLSASLAGFSDITGQAMRLHFHLPNGRSLVRLWRDRQVQIDGTWIDISDDISSFRPTVLEANRTGRPVQGIEVGRGGFVVRGVAPVKGPDGQSLGTVEMLADFNSLFQAAAGPGEHMLLYMNQELLSVARRLKDAPRVGDRYVLISGTQQGTVEKHITLEMLEKGSRGVETVQDGHLAYAAFPVNDYRANQIGVMVFVADTTGISAGIRNLLMLVTGVGAVILLLIVTINYVSLQKVVIRPVKAIAAELFQGASQVSDSSIQLASASQSQAEGANEQASTLEETSASLEEIASQTRQSSDNAEQANRAVEDVTAAVENGAASMARMNDAITEIKRSSEETSKIIQTIDEIAFQTNLLALNAAVEAARAGEAGKGFAVVAEEVRNLAQRSAKAAQNTSELIERSQKNADNGVAVTHDMASQLQIIQKSAGQVNTLISEITAAAREQAQGIEQVNTGVSEMDKVIQKNASDSEESAGIAEQLSAQALDMEHKAAELEAMVGSRESKRRGPARDAGSNPGSGTRSMPALP